MSSSPIKNIIFDVGQVFAAYDPGYITDQILGVTPHKQTYIDTLFLNPIWHALDRGDITPEEAIDALVEKHSFTEPQKHDLAKLLDNFAHHIGLIEGSRDIYLDLMAQGFPIYLLSNFQDKPFAQLVERFTFLNDSHGKVISARVKMMKPEPEIYRHLAAEYNLVPQECVFIDDLADNIAAAEAEGFQGILFVNPSQLAADLAAKNIFVSLA